MALSKNPPLAEFFNMVPPTASHPEYWAAGRTRLTPLHPIIAVAIRQSTNGSQNRPLRRAQRWHQFPASQPPDVPATTTASITLNSYALTARIHPPKPQPASDDWRDTLDGRWQLDDFSMLDARHFVSERDLLRPRRLQKNCSTHRKLLNQYMLSERTNIAQ